MIGSLSRWAMGGGVALMAAMLALGTMHARGDESKEGQESKEVKIDPAWREGSAADRRELNELEGKAAPALQVENWINSEAMTLADLRGKVVVLDFWATWCGPCIAVIPKTNALAAKYADEGLVVIGVCHPRGAEHMAALAKDKGIKYPIAADPRGETIKRYHVNSYPDYFIIDRAGRLRIADCANHYVEDAVKALLREPAPEDSKDVAAGE